jgi:hypothetical protein
MTLSLRRSLRILALRCGSIGFGLRSVGVPPQKAHRLSACAT